MPSSLQSESETSTSSAASDSRPRDQQEPVAAVLVPLSQTFPSQSVQPSQSSKRTTTSRIHVAVRPRPGDPGVPSAWIVEPDKQGLAVRQQFIPHARPQTAKANASQEAARQQQLYSDHAFAFDNVFSETSTTDEIYATCVAGIVEAAFAGINGAILTYGQTGSGKTYTLLGYGDVPGIVGLAVARICSFAQKSPDEVHLRISMLEIYKERIRDLLPEPNSKQSSLKVQDDPLAGVVVKGLTQHRVDDLRTIMQHLHQGNRRRQTASHNMNETSSRSHAIFQISIERRPADAPHDVHISHLSFADLAGSERSDKTGTLGVAKRQQEAAKINHGLLMLGNTIAALADQQQHEDSQAARHSKSTSAKRKDYVSYRNSKLTHVLKPCLGGNAQTFAGRASRVTNHYSVNRLVDHARLASVYETQVVQLQHRLSKIEDTQLQSFQDQVRELEGQVALLRDQNAALQQELQMTRDAAHTMRSLSIPLDPVEVPDPGPTVPHITPLQALRRLGTMTGVPMNGAAKHDDALVQKILASVRQMQVEREALKWRCRDLGNQVHKTTSLGHQEQQQLDVAAEACSRLEQALGLAQSMDSSYLPLPTRVGAVAEMAEMMTAEMQSMQEQHSAAVALHGLDAEALNASREQLERQQDQLQALRQAMQAQSAAVPRLEATGTETGGRKPGGWHLCGSDEAAEPAAASQVHSHSKQKVTPLELAAAEQQVQNAQQQLANLQRQYQQCQEVQQPSGRQDEPDALDEFAEAEQLLPPIAPDTAVPAPRRSSSQPRSSGSLQLARAKQKPKGSWNSPSSPLLPPEAELEMLQRRVVKAERARAAAVAAGAAEKRALRVQLMGAQKAAAMIQQEASQQLKVARQTLEVGFAPA
ncbi:hypothetical protein WJX74_009036 [Apatococcus lobatus]|uniref:Kinesin motor domain-containing protein n=1 Tax=Apatococcus lobatus TaxID=904363 RepID=A0AAW1RM33_9CHLO